MSTPIAGPGNDKVRSTPRGWSFFAALTIAIACACSNDARGQLPEFLQRLTAEIEAGPAADSPGSISSFRYRGQTVYYVPAFPCCDQLSILYDADGALLCSPDGGITGRGDGRCPDFFATRSEETRVWRDARVAAR